MKKVLLALVLLPTVSFAQPAQSTFIKFWDPNNSAVAWGGDSTNNALRVNLVASSVASGGTSSSFGAAFPATGTAAGFIGSTGNMTGASLTAAGNLRIDCQVGCSGSSFADNSAFTFGTTAVSNTAFVVDDTATNTVTENSAGAGRMSTNRIPYFSLHNDAGTAITVATDRTTAAGPFSVRLSDGAAFYNSLTDTQLRATPVPVSLAANQSVNVAQMNGTTVSMNTGVRDAGTQRVTIATNDVVPVSQSGAWTVTTTPPSNASTNVAQFGGTNVSTGTGAGGAGIPRVTISNDSSLAANQSVNLNQVAGAGVATGNGTASGSIRVALPTDGTGVIASITTSVTPGGAAANLGKAEDGTAASGDTGVAVLLTRKDTNATMVSADSEYVAAAADNYGVQSVSLRHPNAIRCTITSTATTSTLVTGCSAPGASLSIYIGSLAWSSSIISTTANFMRIQSGTGGTCGASIDVLYDGFALAFTSVTHNFVPPIKVPANEEVCFVHASAGTRLVNITGFIAP